MTVITIVWVAIKFSDLYDIPWKGNRGQMRPNGDLPMILRDYLKCIEYNLYKNNAK